MLTYRFTGQVRDFLRSTAGAQLRYLRTAMLGSGALGGSPFATPWRQAAGAVLFDLGPHTLDLAEAAAGPIVELRAAEARCTSGMGEWDAGRVRSRVVTRSAFGWRQVARCRLAPGAPSRVDRRWRHTLRVLSRTQSGCHSCCAGCGGHRRRVTARHGVRSSVGPQRRHTPGGITATCAAPSHPILRSQPGPRGRGLRR